MAKIKRIESKDETMWMFQCPGCGEHHAFWTRGLRGPIWNFNGDVECPTVNPSILVQGSPWENRRCHSFIRDGRIQFLEDCTHSLRGQTVELPELD